MPKLIFRDAEAESGYNAIAHVKALMYFPADAERRRAFWMAEHKAAIDADVHEHGFPVSITQDEYETLLHGKWPHELLTPEGEATIKRHGFLAAACLKYLLTAAIHHPTPGSLRDILSVKAWKAHLELTHEACRAAGTHLVSHRLWRFNDETLRPVRAAFMPVAHLWAAYFDDDGNEHPVTDWAGFDNFIALAEGYRARATKYDLYAIAAQALSGDAVHEVATEVTLADVRAPSYVPQFDPDEEWDPEFSALYQDDNPSTDRHHVYDLAEAWPVIRPFPADVVAYLREKAGGQRKRKKNITPGSPLSG